MNYYKGLEQPSSSLGCVRELAITGGFMQEVAFKWGLEGQVGLGARDGGSDLTVGRILISSKRKSFLPRPCLEWLHPTGSPLCSVARRPLRASF